MSEHEWKPPPPGWFTFGTHVDSPGLLEFSRETDEAGMPLWERRYFAPPSAAADIPATETDESATSQEDA